VSTSQTQLTVERIEAALLVVAKLLVREPAYTPIFERLETELAEARKAEAGTTAAQRRARALLAQKAKPASNRATCASDAPLP
jgi:thymidylate kinase